ncbi:OmpA family protein [Aquimarina sp. ERC-38]|uniref:OmpA family protein n=1 Tax=Aquimarina sp. ERC-38 TaxID=2949996 RepID=UPI002246350C|nr:OmpA family protein [Aquimarina sp. ERC-38]UZO79410.1 OmpA family protein [Aquimarina sp. ERC-38]
MKKILQYSLYFIFFTTGFFSTITGQEKRLERAKKQYDKYEYINAQETYLKVVNKGYRSADLFKNLGNSYYFNSEFEEAAKWYKELVDSYPSEVEPEYYFRYAQTLKSAGKYEESDKYMIKFTELKGDDQRAQLFTKEQNYLERIDFQSGRFEIKNIALNTEFSDFGGSFNKKQVVFSSSRDTSIVNSRVHQWNNQPFLDLFIAEFNEENGELTGYREMNGTINTKFHESSGIFTKDGNTLYFTRNNYANGQYKNDQEGTNKLKIFRSYKNANGGWTTPQNLNINSDEFSTAHPALSPDESFLYFSSDRPGGEGFSDIYKVAINSDGSLGEPENLGNRINTPGKDTFPFVSESGDLYFASDGHLGLGGLDIYVTALEPSTTEEGLVVNIGKPVNSRQDDFAFVVDEATKRGLFSSNRDGGKGSDDIYSFLQLEDLKNFCQITMEGLITDADTGDLLSGATVSLLNSENVVVETVITDDTASYSFEGLDCSTSYFVRAEKEEYNTNEKLVTTPGETQTLNQPIAIEKTVKTATIGDDLSKILALNIIYFDFDKYYIREDAKVELAKVVEIMKQYPNMKIDVRSHTDSRGDDAYNLWLSNQRAKATINFIVAQGIDKDRLSGKGYGETELVNECGNGSRCTQEQYELSRRSEFIILD